jgi:hypothetical protein
MHDWQKLIGERLGNLRLCNEAQDDIVRELAAHFEEIHDDARRQGASEKDAYAAAMDSVGNWSRFRRNLRNAKETLMTTTPWKRTVLWPGMLALILSGLSSWLIYALRHSGLSAMHSEYVWRVVWLGESSATVFYVPWLVALPFVGAITAWYARRNGASMSQRLLACAFPGLLNLALIVAALLLGTMLGIDRQVSGRVKFVGILLFGLSWILAPIVTAMLGALPFLGRRREEGGSPAQTSLA